MTEIGKVIRKHRKNLDLSQSQLADLSGLDRTYISLLECDKKSPTVETLAKISQALSVKLSEILSEAGL
jgi:transcriptional regulator with XRE-family HTH domain